MSSRYSASSMNPFDDDDDDDASNPFCDQEFNIPRQQNKQETTAQSDHNISDEYDPSLDPFAEDVPEDLVNINNNCYKLSEKKSSSFAMADDSSSSSDLILGGSNWLPSPKSSNRLNAPSEEYDPDRASLNSLSRLSISSNTSNTIAEQQLRQFSFGDGSFQKEGLICPECMIEFKTITELMEHFSKHDQQKLNTQADQSPNRKLWANHLSPLSKQSLNDSAIQIKGFLNKLVNKPQQPISNIHSQGFSSASLNSGQQSLNENLIDDDNSVGRSSWSQHSILTNPISNWKYSMNIGPIRSHYEEYRKIRDNRIERYVFETNKLLIRLDRLLRDYPPLIDLARRRRHEQSIVDWIDESIVPLCPSCATKFNILTRKRHHCRLCGAVMCDKCSQFITFTFAFELINPVDGNSQWPGQGNISMDHLSNCSFSGETSQSSPVKLLLNKTLLMNSQLGSLNGENLDKLRLCSDCHKLLLLRKEKMDVAHHKAPVVKLYEQLREIIDQIDRLKPVYNRMADSINIGERAFQLKDAFELKHKLTKLGEQADVISRKIESFGVPPDEKGQTSTPLPTVPRRQISIQVSIRRSTIHYLRQNLVGLPELPDEQRFEQLKQHHSEMIEKRIRLEKQMALMEQEQFRQARNKRQQQQQKPSESSMVIIGDQTEAFSTTIDLWQNMNEKERMAILDEQDPMIQQMNLIRSYIQQAKIQHRYEEVAMLEDNLKELEIEYYFTQQQQPPTDLHISPQQQMDRMDSIEKTNHSTNPFGDFDES